MSKEREGKGQGVNHEAFIYSAVVSHKIQTNPFVTHIFDFMGRKQRCFTSMILKMLDVCPPKVTDLILINR